MRSKLYSTLIKALISLSGIQALLGGTAAYASGRLVDVWRSEENSGHYFLRDYGSNTWIETINCRTAFTFKPTKIANDSVELFDATRNMYVTLNKGGLYIWNAATQIWDLYKRGDFDKRFLFYHHDTDNSNHQFFSLKSNCIWSETTGFSFREVSVSRDSIVMYDGGRDLYARITNTILFLRQGGAGEFRFFHGGLWQ